MKRAVALFGLFAAVSAQCGSGLSVCAGQCYNPSSQSCVVDLYTNKNALCPQNNQACNTACFLPTAYHCVNGQLQSGPAATSAAGVPSTSSNTPSTTSSTKAPTTSSTTSSTSSSAAATKAPTTSSSTKAPTTSSTSSSQASTSSSASPASTGSCNTAGCGAGTCNCNGACFTPGQYNCAVDLYNGKNQLCQGSYASCNGNCFDTTKYSCSSSGALVAGGSSNGNGGNTPTPSSATPTSSSATPVSTTSAPAPVVNPSPSPVNRPTQTADLRIINSCKTTLWFEGRYGGQGAPIPGQSVTALQALPGSYIDYTVPDTGLSGSRFWAKYGCDSNGQNCLIGDAMQYWPNPPGGCPAGGCTPPIDSLFEATWGCRPGASCNSQNPTTWFDTSQVDGWTIPYKLTPVGDTSGCDCIGSNCGFSGVDASHLDLAKCPSTENLSYNGQYPSVNVQGTTVPLNSVDLRVIKNNSVIGCMSPCKRLNWGVPYGLQQDESSGATMWMCCPTPTPNNCSPSNGCITPDACRAGPIVNTQFVSAVHTMAPGVYSYSYDDGVGLHACPAGVVKYTMEFCPSGSAQYPLPL